MTEESRLPTRCWTQEITLEESRQNEARRRDRWSENVHINPNVEVLARLTRRAEYGGMRGLLHGGDLYWWDSIYGTHNDATHWLKLTGSKIDTGVEMHVYGDGEIGIVAFHDDTLAAAMAHPTLLDCFDSEGSLITNPSRRLPFGD